MPALPFVKMQAVGNDFVVLHAADVDGLSLASLARAVCERHTGIGADGLLLWEPTPEADLAMRIFNADGTEDTMCGNGLCCVLRLAHDRRMIPAVGEAQTRAGRIPYRIDAAAVQINLGAPRFDPAAVPLGLRRHDNPSGSLSIQAEGQSLDIFAVNTGSTHAVAFVPALPDEATFQFWSPRVEHDPLFPERTSLLWTVVETPERLRLRIWERGVGETRGCGTGAAAAAALARATGRARADKIQVLSAGGTLTIRWEGARDAPLWLCGAAQITFGGVLPFSHPVLE